MQFIYHENSGDERVIIDGLLFTHIFGSRRHNKNNNLFFRNLREQILYEYQVLDISKKSATLELRAYTKKPILPKKTLHIGWCVIDPKSIDSVISTLNEIGVFKVTFIWCDKSQGNYKINKKRLENILIQSSQQCGRSSVMEIDTCLSLESFILNNKSSYLLDFSSKKIGDENIDTIVIGSEGGISFDENTLFANEKIVGFDSDIILKSKSAIIALASKILL
jgi:16S rRNA (uracil1498-N3)-methyltransferase